MIKVKYTDTNFKEVEIDASNLFARVILHELDHLDGILFIDYLPKSRRKEFVEQLEKIKNGDIDTKYPIVSSQRVVL
jgi:peptide deformylase